MATIAANPAGIHLAHHTGFTVSSLDDAIDFWTRVMGFELLVRDTIDSGFISAVIDAPGAELSLAMVQAPGHIVELLEYGGSAKRDVFRPKPCDIGSVHIAFVVEDIRATLARIEAEGWQPYHEPEHVFRGPKEGTLVAYLRDSDGITIELMQPLGPL